MKIFLFYFEMAIKITGSAQNYRVGRVSGNTPIFFRPKSERGHSGNLMMPSSDPRDIHLSIPHNLHYAVLFIKGCNVG